MMPCVAVNSGACFWLHLDSREQIVGLLLLRVRGRIDVEGQFVGSGIPASARVPDEGTEVEEQGLEAMDPRSVFESLGVDLLKCLLGARSRGHGVTRVLGFVVFVTIQEGAPSLDHVPLTSALSRIGPLLLEK